MMLRSSTPGDRSRATNFIAWTEVLLEVQCRWKEQVFDTLKNLDLDVLALSVEASTPIELSHGTADTSTGENFCPF
jgi:hypothetical protein